MLSMDSFDIFRLDRENGKITNKTGKIKRGGGLIIYVKKGGQSIFPRVLIVNAWWV